MVNIIKASALNFSTNLPVYSGGKLSLFMANHACAVSSSKGHIITWGQNDYSRLGFSWTHNNLSKSIVDCPQTTLYEYPFKPNELIKQVSLGPSHAGFLSSLGNLVTTGKNDEGQLGVNKGFNYWININEEFELHEGEIIDQIHFISGQSLALTNQSRVFVWGKNRLEIVNNQKPKITKPTDITSQFSLDKNKQITHLQFVHQSSNTNNDSVNIQMIYVVDHRDVFLRTKDTIIHINKWFDATKMEVESLISHEGTHVLITKNHTLYCFGSNLFDKSKTVKKSLNVSSLIKLSSNDHIVQAALGKDSLVFLTQKGRLFTFGKHELNQLLNPDIKQTDTPVEITDLIELPKEEKIVSVACTDANIGLITSVNRMIVWGSNQFGILGDHSTKDRKEPYEVTIPIFD